MAMKLYILSGSPYAWRVQLALAAKGLTYEKIVLDRSAGDLETEEFKALNPYGKVPVLIDGDVTLYESLAILDYLERKYPEVPLVSADPAEAATSMRRIIERDSYDIEPMRKALFPLFSGTYAENKKEADEGFELMRESLVRYNDLIGEKDYMEGGSPTIFDIALYPTMALSQRVIKSPAGDAIDRAGLVISAEYPRLAAWMARIEAHPGFENTYPPHWKAADAAE